MDHDFEPAPRRCSDLVCRRFRRVPANPTPLQAMGLRLATPEGVSPSARRTMAGKVRQSAGRYNLDPGQPSGVTVSRQARVTMVHLAMHDALNAIVPVYEQYVFAETEAAAHPAIAASQAARDVAAAAYPDHADRFDELHNRRLDAEGEGVGRDLRGTGLTGRTAKSHACYRPWRHSACLQTESANGR